MCMESCIAGLLIGFVVNAIKPAKELEISYSVNHPLQKTKWE